MSPGVFYPQCRAILSAVFDGFGGPDSDPTIVRVLPRSANVHCNGYKEADTFELTFDANFLPFSPELIRSLGVEIYLFNTRGLGDDPEQYATKDNMLVAGLADNVHLTLDNGGRTFICSGRDYTALLLDRTWDQKNKVPVGKDLVTTVQQLVTAAIQRMPTRPKLAKPSLTPPAAAPPRLGVFTLPQPVLPPVPATAKLTVVFEADTDIPVVGRIGATVPNKKAKNPVNPSQAPKTVPKGHSKHGMTHKEGSSYWDVIYKLCLSYGYIVFVRGWEVVIAQPQTLTVRNQNKVRRVAYGYDLSSLEVERKLGKERVPQVIVTCFDPITRKPIKGVYPVKKDPVSTGIGTKKDESHIMTVHGISDPAQLKRIAETAYNNLARAEGKVRFKTKDLASLPAPGAPLPSGYDADLLRLRAGDPIAISWDPYHDAEMRKLDTSGRYAYMLQLGYPASIAQLVAQEYGKIVQFDRPFYVREVNFEFSKDSGVTVDCEALNFIAVERDDLAAKAAGVAAPSPVPYTRL